ncbi:hypothetical protein [Pseudomonas mohnii]
MIVEHDSTTFKLSPNSLAVSENDLSLFGLYAESSDELIFVETPKIVSDLTKVIASDTILKIYQSNHWQEGEFSNLRTKINGDSISIGYAFPITTLSTLSSSISNIHETDPAAAWYALAAIWELLRSSNYEKSLTQVSWGETYNLADFFRQDLVIAVYTPSRINDDREIAANIIEEFAATLAQHKIYSYSSTKSKEKKQNENFITSPHLNLAPCKDINNRPFTDYVTNHLIIADSTECDPLVRFFLQYQFFELIMQRVFSEVISEFRLKIANENYTSDAWKTKELVSKLGEKTSENYRISKIFGFMLEKHRFETEEIINSCKLLLKKIELQKAAEPKDYSETKTPYYKVRNLIFHGFASHSIEKEDINLICDSVEKITYKLCLSFESLSPYFETESTLQIEQQR